MKKRYIFSFVFWAFCSWVQGQTMKRVFYEGFTSANCPPCVPNNAAIKPILAANPTRVVALKYHTNWPGGADFANQNTQSWVGPRVSYYGVTGVPSTRVNGTGTTLTQAVINQQFANTSPFFLEVNHGFINNNTQIEVEVKVRAAQDYTGSQLALHLAMVERQITFSTAPGTNGEREFNDVMRRMYPNPNGTTLGNHWTNNQEQVFSFTVDVPSYIYKIDQIAFVTFIQSNSTKQVLQAAKSVVSEFGSAVAIHNLTGDPTCGDSFEVSFIFPNGGRNQLSSLQIHYGVVGGEQFVYNWSGSLAYGEEAMVTLPGLQFAGRETISVKLANPNNVENLVLYELHGIGHLVNDHDFTSLTIDESFSSGVFPPAGWGVSSSVAGHAWHGHSTNSGSARIELHRTVQNQEDNLYVKPLDLTENGSFNLSFKVAHAMINNTSNGPNDRLMVQLSKDCGQNWTSVYSKSGANLATAPNNAQTVFVPSASQWREEKVAVSSLAGEPNVLVRFNLRSGVGNCLYIDEVKLEATSFLVFFAAEGSNGTVAARLNGILIQSGAGVPPGSSVVFTANPDPNFLIDRWIINGEVLVGNHSQEITIPNIFGLKNVIVVFKKSSTNVVSIAQAAIKIFPVPARTHLNIASDHFIQQLSVINMAGHEVYSASEVGLNHRINTGNFQGGIYVLRINTEQGTIIRKIQLEPLVRL